MEPQAAAPVVADEKHPREASINDFDIAHDHGHNEVAILRKDYEDKPTDEEFATLRRVPGKIPTVAYLLCAVEFCERASYYGEFCSCMRWYLSTHNVN